MVIYLEQGADLHVAQLMPLPLTVSCFSKFQIGFIFLVPAHPPGSPGQRAVKRVCVKRVCVDVHTYEINGIKSLVVKTIKKFYFMLDVWTALNKCSRGKQGSHGLQTLSPVLPHGSLL